MPSKVWWTVASLLLAAPVTAQNKPSPPLTGNDIIVIGKRSADAEKALAACIARHCPPSEEIDASLVLAQEQFKEGDYHAARASILKARSRNARFAKQYPVAVANLYHADGVVARNLGLADSEWSGALDAISAMKSGLPSNDPRVFIERIELGDAYARAGRFEASADEFRQVAAHAHSLGLKPIEGTALLRIAILYARLATQSPALYAREANRAIDTVVALSDPAYANFVDAARQLRVQIAGQSGNAPNIDDAVAAFDPLPAGAKSQLLYAPRIDLGQRSGPNDSASRDTFGNKIVLNADLAHMAMDSFEGQWIDIAFIVGRDGKVSDAHIAKHGPHLQKDWTEQVLASVSQRRYRRQTTESAGSERYTFTSNWKFDTGSHIMQRSPTPRLEEVDLSD